MVGAGVPAVSKTNPSQEKTMPDTQTETETDEPTETVDVTLSFRPESLERLRHYLDVCGTAFVQLDSNALGSLDVKLHSPLDVVVSTSVLNEVKVCARDVPVLDVIRAVADACGVSIRFADGNIFLSRSR